MSFLNVAPEMVAAAADNVESIGSALTAAQAAAAAPTIELVAPAADGVSIAVTAAFGSAAEEFQELGAQAAAFHEQIVALLNTAAAAYAGAEATAKQALLGVVNGPAQALLGHSLVGPTAGGYTAAAADGASGGVVGALLGDPLLGVPFSAPYSFDTPFGPVALTLNGTASPLGEVVIDSGSLNVPLPLRLGVNALGPAITTAAALQASGTAFSGAVQSGDLLGAAGALLTAPGSAVNGFLFGQTAISQMVPAPDGSGYTSVDVSVPVGGLLAPTSVATLTLTPTSGAPTAILLDGSKFGGLITGLLDDFVPGF